MCCHLGPSACSMTHHLRTFGTTQVYEEDGLNPTKLKRLVYFEWNDLQKVLKRFSSRLGIAAILRLCGTLYGECCMKMFRNEDLMQKLPGWSIFDVTVGKQEKQPPRLRDLEMFLIGKWSTLVGCTWTAALIRSVETSASISRSLVPTCCLLASFA